MPNKGIAQSCFSNEVADQMLVYIEQCKILEEQLSQCTNGDAELEKQIADLKGLIKDLQDKTKAEQDKTGICQSQMQAEQDAFAIKEKSYQEQIKAAKPSFWENFQKYLSGAAIGAGAFGLLLLVVL